MEEDLVRLSRNIHVELSVTKEAEHYAARIDALRSEIRKTTSAGILKIGRELAGAQRELARHGSGTFRRWCEERLKLKKGTAYNWIAVYEVFGDCPNFVQSYDPSALYELSKQGVPRWAIEESMSIAKAGGVITRKRAKELIAAAYAQVEGEAPDSPIATGVEDGEAVSERRWPTKRDKSNTPLDKLKRCWEDASQEERRVFKQWVKERQVKTELDAESGLRKVVPDQHNLELVS